MTFSIVGRDPVTGDLGVAVASKFLAVGAVVPYVKFGVGAVATQSYVNPAFGPRGLELLGQGLGPEQVSARFEGEDGDIAQRQFGLISATGQAQTFTGSECHGWAGGLAGPDYAIQGNILTGPEVVQATLEGWQGAQGQPLPRRLLAALQAGDAAGGDKRGRQSAALVCAGQGRGYAGLSDDWVNLRADDHPDPCAELERLLGLYELLFDRPQETRELSGEELAWLRALLVREGYARELAGGPWDQATEAAAWALYGTENLEERWVEGGRVDPQALKYLQEKFGAGEYREAPSTLGCLSP
ncbi:DUF1028 domain-containing protein [Deinococcus radiophilus]|uniref:DUF1028 domain-containing protein n=1 Tax=Deinococcus radiophilus TaxID=32062 RepID=A0A3S0IK40_9DEIO|nr:DUF1028 domain-containing protein [Deinococcus radiophilus]RTR25809.1 DUF1028 domain-containing protein [Deinococcus radiophilus]UFA50855.1 DUF1028 domain-containing protein [Deinococcus radiophilus]